MDKKKARLVRASKARYIIKSNGIHRLTIYRTPKHIYAQIFTCDGSKVLASASTLQAELKSDLVSTGNITAAKAVGVAIAKKAIEQGIDRVAFDRSGFKYHGRIQALADAARETGLSF
jgi:large subunit ribosomal protein L18